MDIDIPCSSRNAFGHSCAARESSIFTEEVAMPTHLSARTPVRTIFPFHAGPQTPSWTNLEALDRSNRRTAIELHRQVSRPHRNMVASPFNVQAALSMLYTGARNHTEKEMSRYLSWDLAPAQRAAACRAIRDRVVENACTREVQYASPIFRDRPTPPATLHLAHRIWVDPSVPVEPEFEDALALHFDSTAGSVDFSNTVAASERINSWASEQTRGCIPSLVTPRALTNARVVLTTAIYLQACWKVPFRMEVQPQPFTPDDEPPRPLRMMTLKEHFRTHETRDYEAVDVPFSANELSMRLFRPKHSLAQLEATLREVDLSGSLGNERRIHLTLAPFTVTTDLELSEQLKQMGQGGMFNNVPAKLPDFSGMSKVVPPLRVDGVIHKAFIRVDKNGTEAAAATAIIAAFGGCGPRLPPPPKLTFDCSFLFMIHDGQRPLFLGRVHAPSEEG